MEIFPCAERNNIAEILEMAESQHSNLHPAGYVSSSVGEIFSR